MIAPNASIYGGDGDDVITTGGSGNYHIETGDGDDTVYGGDGDDYIVMGSLANGGEITYGAKTIFAGGGDDVVYTFLDHSETDDVIDGGDGWDKIIVWAFSIRHIAGDWEAIEEVDAN